MKKNDEETVNEEKTPKKSFTETIALMVRRRWLSNTAQTIAIVVILLAAFIGINLYVQSLELEPIDVTKNKIYTLSDASKDVIKNVNKDVKIYLYGIEEDSTIADFIKQYTKVNNHITSEILTEKSNLEKVQKYELTSGYEIIIIECGDASKLIDSSYELYSYDYTTGQEVDQTEQVLTNSILALASDQKPKLYFTTGHQEYTLEKDLLVLGTYLKNEAYDAAQLNLLTEGKVPDDCSILVIMAPVKDFTEQEVESVLTYINNGGNLIIASDIGNLAETYPNLQRVYDQYGTTLNHSGYVYETDSKYALPNYPSIFMPRVSDSHDITSEIYSEGTTLWLPFAGKLTFASEEEMKNLKVEKEDLLYSSEESLFVNNLELSAEEAAKSADKGSNIISSLLTKTIKDAEGEEPALESKALIIANATFITDYKVKQLSENYPISYLANNKDYVLNSVAYLTKKENTLKIRKDMSTSTYTATEQQHKIVLAIIFIVPLTIIIAGIVVWNLRRRKR